MIEYHSRSSSHRLSELAKCPRSLLGWTGILVMQFGLLRHRRHPLLQPYFHPECLFEILVYLYLYFQLGGRRVREISVVDPRAEEAGERECRRGVSWWPLDTEMGNGVYLAGIQLRTWFIR